MQPLISTAAFLAILLSTPEPVWSDAAGPGQCQAEIDQCEGYRSAEAAIQHAALQQAQSSSRSTASKSSNTDSTASSGFPSNNSVRRMTGRQLQELLSSFSTNSTSSNSSAVVLFYLETCPHSSAVRPVFECLAAFFPENVVFASVSYSDMSLMLLMTHGLHALPVLQVNRQGRKYRYSGKHWLGPMLAFVAKALGREPLAKLEVAQLCSQGQQQLPMQHQHAAMQQNAINPADTDPGARRSNTADDANGTVSSSGSEPNLEQQQQSVVCGNWSCSRWDGEATAEELSEQKHATLFWASVAFLVCRAVWWTWQRATTSRQAREQAANLPAAAPAVEAVEPPAAGDANDLQQQQQGQQPIQPADDGAGTSEGAEAPLHS